MYGVYVTRAGRYKRLDLIFVAAPCLPHALLGWTGSTVFLRLLKDHCNRQARADSQGRGYLTTNHHLYDRKSECAASCLLGENQCVLVGPVVSGLWVGSEMGSWRGTGETHVLRPSGTSCIVQPSIILRLVNGIQCCMVSMLKVQAAVCLPCMARKYNTAIVSTSLRRDHGDMYFLPTHAPVPRSARPQPCSQSPASPRRRISSGFWGCSTSRPRTGSALDNKDQMARGGALRASVRLRGQCV